MDRRRKPAIREPRPELTMDEMRAILSELKEIESVTGIRYIKITCNRQNDYRHPGIIGQGIHHQPG